MSREFLLGILAFFGYNAVAYSFKQAGDRCEFPRYQGNLLVHPVYDGLNIDWRCCVEITCEAGEYGVPCNNENPKTTRCVPCSNGHYKDVTSKSYMKYECQRHTTCAQSHGEKVKTNGTIYSNVICECDSQKGYYGTPPECHLSILLCSVGKQLSENECLPCPAGSYKNKTGAGHCINCTICPSNTQQQCNKISDAVCDNITLHMNSNDVRSYIIIVLIVFLVSVVVSLVFICKTPTGNIWRASLHYFYQEKLRKRFCAVTTGQNDLEESRHVMINDLPDLVVDTRDDGEQREHHLRYENNNEEELISRAECQDGNAETENLILCGFNVICPNNTKNHSEWNGGNDEETGSLLLRGNIETTSFTNDAESLMSERLVSSDRICQPSSAFADEESTERGDVFDLMEDPLLPLSSADSASTGYVVIDDATSQFNDPPNDDGIANDQLLPGPNCVMIGDVNIGQVCGQATVNIYRTVNNYNGSQQPPVIPETEVLNQTPDETSS